MATIVGLEDASSKTLLLEISRQSSDKKWLK